MNEENKFYLYLTGILCGTLLLVLLFSFVYWHSKYWIISSMVNNGSDPIRAACSLEVGNSAIRDCVLVIAK